MGRKCSVQGCLSDSNRVEDVGVTFHKAPMQSEIRTKWFGLCRISEEKMPLKVIHVCSRHFLRADFCNFKGKKYMLRHGVFPSVFPWDKSKLEAIKSEKLLNKAQTAKNPMELSSENEAEVKTEPCDTDPIDPTDLPPVLKNENISTNEIDFFIDNRINALDFNNKWCPATIKEVDEEENEVLLHFESDGNEYDEWVSMNSPRLRPYNMKDLQNLEENLTSSSTSEEISNESGEKLVEEEIKSENTIKYEVGEHCSAYWSEKKKFPAVVSKVMKNDTYEVTFEDGYVKCLKWNKMIKYTQPYVPSSSLFEPIQTSKEERREKKRKHIVSELFARAKRQKSESLPNSPKMKLSSNPAGENVPKHMDYVDWESEQVPVDKVKDEITEEDENWLPRWVNGHPVGINSQLEFQDGTKRSVIVPDPRLPEGWAKHLYRRNQGSGSCKWDTIIVGPDGKKLRSKTEIKNYLEHTKFIPYDEKLFDFRITLTRPKKVTQAMETKKSTEVKSTPVKPAPEIEPPTPEEKIEEDANLLKILLVDDGYKCPIEGCDKSFRKENLAQMHVKHYHPAYSKFLDTTPNVADLAYARTVGDSLDKSPVPSKASRIKHATPKPAQNQPNSPMVEESETTPQQVPPSSKLKDSEIIKLLNAKPYDVKSEGEPLPPGLPLNMYPDIKLKDLLSKSEGIPKRDDINMKTLSSTRPPAGIKTLLPVRKPDIRTEEESVLPEAAPKHRTKTGGKRKKITNEQPEPVKMKEIKEEYQPPVLQPVETVEPPETNTVIIEGGELIKIVRMKQEEIINCTCGFMEEDGLMIQCELCLCWQHAYCNNIQKESEVPDKYVCYICQHPLRQRSSKKFIHDQDWLKQGVLPVGSYHSKDEEVLQKRFGKLKKSHDISGGLGEIQEFVNTLKVKLKIAEAKNHPKLYLWSKPWEKLPLPEKMEQNQENPVKEENLVEKLEKEEENQLTRDLKCMIEINQLQVPIIPQPEAAIETADCKLNLLDHILHSQNLVLERLDDFEKELENLEENCTQMEKDEEFPRTRQTLQMLMRDLNKLEELSLNTSI